MMLPCSVLSSAILVATSLDKPDVNVLSAAWRWDVSVAKFVVKRVSADVLLELSASISVVKSPRNMVS